MTRTLFLRPAHRDEALALRAAHPGCRVLAGGTDLMVAPRVLAAAPVVLDVFGVPGLVGVTRAADGVLSVAASTTYSALLASEAVHAELPLLAAAARDVGAWQIQARGTLGGNVGTCSPVGDTLPALIALGGHVVLASTRGERALPFEEFCTGYRRTALADDELIVSLRFPARALYVSAGARHAWRKVGTRRTQSVSKVMLAACAPRAEGDVLGDVRVALGAVAERPVRARAVEDVLRGARVDGLLARRAADALDADIAPIDDLRSDAAYRRDVARRLVQRFVLSLA